MTDIELARAINCLRDTLKVLEVELHKQCPSLADDYNDVQKHDHSKLRDPK